MPNSPGHTTQLTNLLELLESGDEAARTRLIEHSCERLRLLTRKMLRQFPKVRRWEETDDVFVEAATKLHRSLETVRPESPRHFYNLAASQVRRVLIDMARKHFGPLGTGANQDTGKVSDRASEPKTLEEWTEFHEQVEALPDLEREVFGLVWYEGLNQAEVAEVLGIGVRTVKRRWQSARCLLVKSLEDMPN